MTKTGPIAAAYWILIKGDDPQTRQTEDETMKTNPRFIKSTLDTATTNDTVLPWVRGARRAAFIAKRTATPAVTRKSA